MGFMSELVENKFEWSSLSEEEIYLVRICRFFNGEKVIL